MHNVNFTQAYNFCCCCDMIVSQQPKIIVSGGYQSDEVSADILLFPRFSLCVGEIEIEDLNFDRQTDSAMATSDSNPATPHPSFVVTSVYFRFVFSSSFITHNNIQSTVYKCYTYKC